MEHRDDGLLVDFSGMGAKQEKELGALDQETRLMRAMNEIREYSPSKMSTAQREMFDVMCDRIFRKYGLTPENYREFFGHLGTPQNLRR